MRQNNSKMLDKRGQFVNENEVDNEQKAREDNILRMSETYQFIEN